MYKSGVKKIIKFHWKIYKTQVNGEIRSLEVSQFCPNWSIICCGATFILAHKKNFPNSALFSLTQWCWDFCRAAVWKFKGPRRESVLGPGFWELCWGLLLLPNPMFGMQCEIRVSSPEARSAQGPWDKDKCSREDPSRRTLLDFKEWSVFRLEKVRREHVLDTDTDFFKF